MRHFRRSLSLAELKERAEGSLVEMPLVRRGNRLSVMRVIDQQCSFILSLDIMDVSAHP